MSDFPLIVSYYTEDAVYGPCKDRLLASLDKFNLDRWIIPATPRGTWTQNTCFKANIIDACLRAQARDIVWLDIDSEVMQFPALFGEIKADIAAHLHEGHQLNGATIFFRNKMEVLKLVESWKISNKVFPKKDDQFNLQRTLGFFQRRGLTFEELPFSYARIFDYEGDPPVIMQYQASRQGKALYGTY